MSEGLIMHPGVGLAVSPPLWGHPLRDLSFKVSSEFGAPRGQKNHGGIDYPVRRVPVYSPADGVIIRAETFREETGLMVAIVQREPVKVQHELMHLEELAEGVFPGREIIEGQSVGISGNTGYRWTANGRERVAWHLHWQVRMPDGPGVAELVRRFRGLPVRTLNDPRVLVLWADWMRGKASPEQVRQTLGRLESNGISAIV